MKLLLCFNIFIKSDEEPNLLDNLQHIREINNKISKLKNELLISNDKELTRAEWLDKVEKILIGGKNDIKAVYIFD